MNFEKLKNFLKKNYKKIIVACLIFCLVSNKAYEKFTVSEALDGMKATEKKVNDAFSKVDKDNVSFDKNVSMNKHLDMKNNIALNKNQIRLASVSDANHVIFYNKDVDGPEIKGYKGISLATVEGGVKRVVEIKKDSMKVNGKICIGGTCIDESHLQMLTGARDVYILSQKNKKYLQNGNFTSNVKGSDHSHNLSAVGEFDGKIKGGHEKMRLHK
ncbi:uncharacterized protein METZ01_LOCUS78963 [marine metagenome]|uniref:Uncharacterized protein n=1 Tax=marine metagenome TaxID=408172 RepID=A0A381UD97_9ZZZZ